MTTAIRWPRSAGFVRGWVHLYTKGLPQSLRDERREETDADLWEEAQEAALEGRSNRSLAAQVFLRWLLGVPDDALWRLAHIGAKDLNKGEGRAMIQTGNYRTMTVVMGIIGLALVVGLAINQVIGEMEFRRQAHVAFSVEQGITFVVFLPLGIMAIAAGFRVLANVPSLGMTLITTGSLFIAVLLYWLILPVILAVGIIMYGANKVRKDGDFEGGMPSSLSSVISTKFLALTAVASIVGLALLLAMFGMFG